MVKLIQNPLSRDITEENGKLWFTNAKYDELGRLIGNCVLCNTNGVDVYEHRKKHYPKVTKEIRSEKEIKAYIEYEQKLLELKVFVYRKGYSITINSNNGMFMIYDTDEMTLLKEVETVQDVYDYFK